VSSPLRVAVVDDHQLFREGVIELLATLPSVRVIGQAGTGAGAIELAERTRPDVMLLDLDMPDTVENSALRGGGTTRQILAVSPGTRIVVLTMHDDARRVSELVNAGASGYLLKSAGRDELQAAVTAAARGDDSVVVSVSRSTALGLASSGASPTTLLTPREVEVLALTAEGGSNRVIARELHISESTVKRHLATISTKVGATGRVDVINKARRLGLLSG
jgi:DNA-binding NarL/FixJ family response regulator